MTVYEKHLAAVEEVESRRKLELERLDVALKIEQDKCRHKWGPRIEAMSYALGETYPGKRCLKCGAGKNVD